MTLRRLLGSAALLALVAGAAWAAFAWFGAVRYERAIDRFTAVLGAPEIATLANASAGGECDAAQSLVAAAESFALTDVQSAELSSLVGLPPDAWDERRLAAANRLLAAAAPVVAFAAEVGRCGGGRFEIRYEDGPTATLPPYRGILAALRVVDVEARVALARGDLETLRDDLRTLAGALRVLDEDSLLISTLVGFAIDKRRLSLLRDTLAAGTYDDALLAEAAAALDLRNPAESLRRGLRGEGSFISAVGPRDLLHHAGDSFTPFGRLRNIVQAPAYRLVQASVLDDYSEVGAQLGRPWPELAAELEQGALLPRFWSRRSPLFVNLRSAVARLKALESAHELARASVAIARGDAPHLAAAAFTGELYELAVEGEVRKLSAPGAQELWDRLLPPATRPPVSPPFEWAILGN